jgi:CBS-domain-containing membrane protein
MQRLFDKLKGDGGKPPPRPSFKRAALAGLGAALAIAVLSALTTSLSAFMLLGSFGSSCAMVFSYPDIPFAQPRNLVVGHVISSLIGLIFLSAFGAAWWSLGLAVGTAIALMLMLKIIHPPAASNPVIVFLSHPGWGFLWFPTLAGAIVLVLVGIIYNNAMRRDKYPRYW